MMRMRLLLLLFLLSAAFITSYSQSVDNASINNHKCANNEAQECKQEHLPPEQVDDTTNNNNVERNALDDKKASTYTEPEYYNDWEEEEEYEYEWDEEEYEYDEEEEDEPQEFILDMGVPQIFDVMDDDIDYEDVLQEYKGGAAHLVAVAKNPELRHTLEKCKNFHRKCSYWAAQGKCDANSFFMTMKCCPVCNSAWLLDWYTSCPMDSTENAWQAGDVDAFFSNLTTHKAYKQYTPTIHSSPKHGGGPWVVTLENVITEQEASTLIKHGNEFDWQESFTASDALQDGSTESVVSDYRTSKLAWCVEESCYQDPVVQAMERRFSNITNLHSNHSDWIQLLKYEKGNYYKDHHDIQHYQIYSSAGARILTFYIYLSDVEIGGETRFPLLNLTIKPKLGRALLWPNVLNKNPNEMDKRMFHQAMPVIKGIKYGATTWWHQRDFKSADEAGCAQ